MAKTAADRNFEAWNTIEDAVELRDEIVKMVKRLRRRKVSEVILGDVHSAIRGLNLACDEIYKKHGIPGDVEWDATRKKFHWKYGKAARKKSMRL